MSQPNGPAATCGSCGAPDNGELVHCNYCKHPVSAEALARAIPCPNPACRTACRWGKQKCTACQAWLVVSCIFCGSISPHNCSNCLRCNEAFVGAAQRKQHYQQQQQQHQQRQQHQQNMQAVGTWGHVAAAFAGAAVGGAIGSHHSGGYYSSNDDYDYASSSDDYDVSDVVEDIGGGFFDD